MAALTRTIAGVDVADVEAFSPVLASIIFAPDHFTALGIPVSAEVSAVEVDRRFKERINSSGTGVNPSFKTADQLAVLRQQRAAADSSRSRL